MSEVTRRDFLATTATAAAGLVVAFHLPLSGGTASTEFAPNAYVHIAPRGKVSIVVARSEMGQGVRTSLPMILAEELDCDFATIAIEQAGASTLFGDQTTGGSASVRTCWDPMRKAGAQARAMLLSAAAKQWKVAESECATADGFVVHSTSNRRAGYGSLATVAAKLPVPAEPKLKDNADFKLIGKRQPRIDTKSKVNGTAIFGIDFKVPGMKYSLLARAPKFGATVRQIDDSRAKALPGVTHVAKIGDSAVAVVGDSVWAAMQGRRALKVTWENGPNAGMEESDVTDGLRAAAKNKGVTLYSSGDVTGTQGKRVEAEYQTPFLAHAPMEPQNCVAHFRGTECELWAPTQVPQDVRDSVAQALGLKPENVTVNVTLMGGGFGRRLEHDYGVEAALVSKAVSLPVKVLWTREDDMKFSTYRPVSLHQLSASVGEDGYPTSITHRIIAPSISRQKGTKLDDGLDPDLKDEGSFIYQPANVLMEYVDLDTAVPLGWMRSVYASQVAFAQECFLDELAGAAGKDPLELRLHLLQQDKQIKFFDTVWSTARLRGVLKLAAEKAGWSKPAANGRYRGIAAHGCFGTYVAEVVEISMQGDAPKVERVVVAIDCGQVVNPNILEQQLQSAVVFALTQALHGKITVNAGGIEQSNFGDYQLARMNEVPVVESYFVKSTEAPTGAGEPPVPPFAPALCGAIYVATKKRIRTMPISS
ncbi:MAG TPA: xanthine dehydrogenase family protein molybdopterin-binding subunit [Candidatus Koribacter sp.]